MELKLFSSPVKDPKIKSFPLIPVTELRQAVTHVLSRTYMYASLEAHGQLVGATAFSEAKVYNEQGGPLNSYTYRTVSEAFALPIFDW